MGWSGRARKGWPPSLLRRRVALAVLELFRAGADDDAAAPGVGHGPGDVGVEIDCVLGGGDCVGAGQAAQWAFGDLPDEGGSRGGGCDPESTPADVARLARDPEAEVRRRAAEDPRLSPADAVRLLNDPVAHVRGTAVRNPRLPARVLAGLLHDRDTACEAVTNPAIPVPVRHRILPPDAAAPRWRRALSTGTPHGAVPVRH
ncbi:hypothetical protein [Streptomyces canus]|uniref:hypothetical protein n=1 Tax=Streptomyces canus TaxID=58343 RepID=UPI0036EA38E4